MDFMIRDMTLAKHLVLVILVARFAYSTPYRHQAKQVLVGILTQPTFDEISLFGEKEDMWSYVAGSYVDWASEAGALPVLIPFDLPKYDIDTIMQNIQMVILPGGGASLKKDDDVTKPSELQITIDYIIKKVKKINDEGRFFPLYATCLGFEGLLISENNQDTSTLDCQLADEHKNHSVALNSTALKQSKLWNFMPFDKLNEVLSRSVMYFTHSCGIKPEHFISSPRISSNFLLIGKSKTLKGVEFVSMIEHKNYPILGSQFHPEKTQFENRLSYSFMDRSAESIYFCFKLINSLVNSVRDSGIESSAIPVWMEQYISTKLMPNLFPIESYQRVYTFPRLDSRRRNMTQ